MPDFSKIVEPTEEFKPYLGIFDHPELRDISLEAAARIFEGYLRGYDAAKKHAMPSPETLRLVQTLSDAIEKNVSALDAHRKDNDRDFGEIKTLLQEFKRCHEEILPAFLAVRDTSTFLRYAKIVGTGVIGLLLGIGTIVGAVAAFKRWILN